MSLFFVMKLLNYFHTVKYLKFSQLYYRLLKRFIHPKVHHFEGEIAAPHCNGYVFYPLYNQKFFANNSVMFLNQEGKVDEASKWNDETRAKLWLYNLHYFDDLSALDAQNRKEIQVEFISKWINENPAPLGNGWEPYPTSLRIVNWIKSFLSGITPDCVMLNSLAQQADFLSQNLERHLLGNHLFVNAKALIFAGCFFEGKKADKWLKTGLSIYKKELIEQVLADGGNYELTPMYHVIMLVDLLDLINLWSAYSNKVNAEIVETTKHKVNRMIDWLACISHNDGEISFFNDTTFEIAPKNAVVMEYAEKLGFDILKQDKKYPISSLVVHNLEESGYVSVKSDSYSLIADLALVGPSYQPGHAHADTLSFELALYGQRIFVNSGISEYGLSKERLRQRKTVAHNTVSVNELDSSQVWSGFRVAKRASVIDKLVKPIINNCVSFTASHNGFKQQGVNCIHRRNWRACESTITIIDELVGDYDIAKSYLHLHPNILIEEISENRFLLVTGNVTIYLDIIGAKVLVEDTTWHPAFGISLKNQNLCFSFLQSKMTINIKWSIT